MIWMEDSGGYVKHLNEKQTLNRIIVLPWDFDFEEDRVGTWDYKTGTKQIAPPMS